MSTQYWHCRGYGTGYHSVACCWRQEFSVDVDVSTVWADMLSEIRELFFEGDDPRICHDDFEFDYFNNGISARFELVLEFNGTYEERDFNREQLISHIQANYQPLWLEVGVE